MRNQGTRSGSSQGHRARNHRLGIDFLGLILTLLLAMGAQAASVPTGFQEYIALGNDQHMWDMYDYVTRTEGGGGALNNSIKSITAITASSDNQIVVLDQWEDGFEPCNLMNPSGGCYLTPSQTTSTLIFGDGVPDNGRVCDFVAGRACTGGANDDLFFVGETITLRSDEGTAPNCTQTSAFVPPVPSAYPANLLGCVRVNPRNSAQVRFDGGDWMASSGGPVSIVRISDPEMAVGAAGIVAGASEVISKQAVGNAFSYTVPVGRDLYDGVNNSVGEPFQYVYLDLAAYEDNTKVSVVSPGATGGSVSFTLNKGQHYLSGAKGGPPNNDTQGCIDLVCSASYKVTINAGTKISTDKPISGLILGGGEGNYSCDAYTLLPDLLHSTDYITVAPGDDPAVGDPGWGPANSMNLYIFNPDPQHSLTVNLTYNNPGPTTATALIQPGSETDFRTATGIVVPSGTTVRLTSDRNFWGVSAYDYTTPAFDWGHSWLATKFLTDVYTVPYSPDGATGEAPVHVAPTVDNTCIWVDFDNDGTYDAIAAPLADPTTPTRQITGPCAGGYKLNALQALEVTDPGDNDNTGTRIISSKPVAVAYGQNTDRSLGVNPAGISDYGYTVYPVSQKFLDPVLTLGKGSDVTRVPLAGGPVVYTLTLTAYDFGPLSSLKIADLLPATGTYRTNSTVITFADLSQISGAAAEPTFPVSPQTLDWSALFPASLNANEVITVEYTVDYAAAVSSGVLTNSASAEGRIGGSVFSPNASHIVSQTDVTLGKTVSGSAQPGGILTYTITVNNNPSAAQTAAVVTDAIPADTTYVSGSATTAAPFAVSYSAAQRAVVWTGDVPVNSGPYTFTFQVRINPAVAEGTVITNTATFESDETFPFSTEAVTSAVAAPRLTVTKSLVGDPTEVHPGQPLVFDIVVANTGGATATDLLITDTLPTNATYLAGSMQYRRNSTSFGSLSDASDADEGTLSATRVEFGSPLATYADFFGTQAYNVSSDGTLTWSADWNEDGTDDDSATAGDLQILADGAQTYVLRLRAANNRIYREADLSGMVRASLSFDARRVALDTAGDWVAVDASGDGGGSWTELGRVSGIAGGVTDASYNPFSYDLGPFMAADTRVRFRSSGTLGGADIIYFDNVVISGVPSATSFDLDAGEDVTFRFTVTPDAGTNGQILNNQASASSTEVPAVSSNLVQKPIYGDATVTGHVFLDYDGSGTQNGVEPDLADLTVVITDSRGNAFSTTTDANGDYSVTVPAGDTETNVDESDQDFPPNSSLSTGLPAGNDPQTVIAVAGATRAATDVGYQPTVPLAISKTSDVTAAGVVAGDTITYTVAVTNYSAFNQSNVVVEDVLPAGVTYVAQSTTLQEIEDFRDLLNTAPVNGAGAANNPGYARNDGTRNWTGPWTEVADNDDDFSGDVQLANDGGSLRLRLTDGAAGGTNNAESSVYREVDLRNAASAALFFDYRRVSIDNGEALYLDVSANGGGAWTNAVFTFGPGTDGAYQTIAAPGIDLTPFIGQFTRIRLRATAGLESNDLLYVDNVQVRAVYNRTNVPASANALTNGVPSGTLPFVTPLAGNLVVAADAVGLPPYETMTLTFQATVDDPPPAVATLANTAGADSDQEANPPSDTSIDALVRPGVSITPTNSATVYTNLANQTVTFRHRLTNTGTETDSYTLAVHSFAGWGVRLLDPDTGAVLGVDSNGDGTWDAGYSPNSGNIAANAFEEYLVEVTVPGGTAAGASDAIRLTATSVRSPLVSGQAGDSVTVIGGTAGPVLVTPDNSGTGVAPGYVAYTHVVTNNMGTSSSFALSAGTTRDWTVTFYQDSNGDGVYTDGTDVAITNTRVLADSESQTIFAKVAIPGGAPANATDVATILATSNVDPLQSGFANDTTVLRTPGNLKHDLTGGGTHTVSPGTIDIFPGRLFNTGTQNDSYQLTLTPSPSWYGLPADLWVDTNGDDTPDALCAVDPIGDGIWDTSTVYPACPLSGGVPAFALNAAESVAYELRRSVPAGVSTELLDAVTLSATSVADSANVVSVTATTAVVQATRASVGSFEAVRDPAGLAVVWTTVSELGTLGFHLERRDGENGEWSRVNDRLLPGLITSRSGGTYRYLDRAPPAGVRVSYRLIELEASGRTLVHGPYSVRPKRLATAAALTGLVLPADAGPYLRIPRPLPERYERRRATPADTPQEALLSAPAAAAPRVAKFSVERDGIYSLSRSALAAALGRTTSQISTLILANGIRVTSRGRLVPVQALPGGAGILVRGLPPAGPYASHNVYWVQAATGLRMAAVDGSGGSATQTASWFLSQTVAEKDLLDCSNLVTDVNADFWMWDYLFPGIDPDHELVEVEVPSPGARTGAPALLTVDLLGGNDTPADLDHHAVIALNGTVLGEAHWGGTTPHAFTASIDPALLRDGDNTLAVTGVLDPGVEMSIFYLNRALLSYPRRYRAVGNRLLATNGSAPSLAIDGFTDARISVYDVTSSTRPRLVRGVVVKRTAPGRWRALLRTPVPGRRYLALTPGAVRSAPSFKRDVPSNLRGATGAEYLVITRRDLLPAARTIAALRTARGLSSLVVDVENVYDEFSYGVQDPRAIRAFLAYAASTWAVKPRYVLLAGEGSYDFKNHLGLGDCVVPPLLVSTPDGLFPSDGLLADITGGDRIPDVAIGRVPALINAELAAFAAKLAAYEAAPPGPWQRRALIGADIPDKAGDFSASAEQIATVFPGDYEVTRLYLDTTPIDVARAELKAALEDGLGLFAFVGHGGFTVLGNEGLFTTGDLATLANGATLPVVTAFTCLAGGFGIPGVDALGDMMVLAPDRGAIAVFAPSGLALNEHSTQLGLGFVLGRLRGGSDVLGDATLGALRSYGAQYPYLPLISLYNLVGDPATVLP